MARFTNFLLALFAACSEAEHVSFATKMKSTQGVPVNRLLETVVKAQQDSFRRRADAPFTTKTNFAHDVIRGRLLRSVVKQARQDSFRNVERRAAEFDPNITEFDSFKFLCENEMGGTIDTNCENCEEEEGGCCKIIKEHEWIEITVQVTRKFDIDIFANFCVMECDQEICVEATCDTDGSFSSLACEFCATIEAAATEICTDQIIDMVTNTTTCKNISWNDETCDGGCSYDALDESLQFDCSSVGGKSSDEVSLDCNVTTGSTTTPPFDFNEYCVEDAGGAIDVAGNCHVCEEDDGGELCFDETPDGDVINIVTTFCTKECEQEICVESNCDLDYDSLVLTCESCTDHTFGLPGTSICVDIDIDLLDGTLTCDKVFWNDKECKGSCDYDAESEDLLFNCTSVGGQHSDEVCDGN